jgi:large repetitive protein
MKKIFILLLFIFSGIFFENANAINCIAVNKKISPLDINKFDKVVFDLENAVFTGKYIDVPIRFLSNDEIGSIDFAAFVNSANLVYDTINNFIPIESTSHLDNLNILRVSVIPKLNSDPPFPVNKAIFSVRFHFVNPSACNQFTKSDFIPTKAYLNGDSCSIIVTEPPPFKVPIANFIYSAPCLGSKVSFNDTSRLIVDKIVSRKWNFGNGTTSTLKNPEVTFNSITSYTVTLIVVSEAGCADTVSKKININISPKSDFFFAPDCSTGNILFTDNSKITPPGKITNWHWNFGDKRQLDNVKNPVYNYDHSKTFTVGLTVTSDSGCTSTSNYGVNMNLLNAYFSTVNGCIGETVDFKDSSTSSTVSGSITNYLWNFGDGSNTVSTIKNPSFTYKQAGSYTVNLKVSNATCADNYSKIIVVENKPKVLFTADKLSGCMPLKVTFTDTSIVESAPTYIWNFDGVFDTTTSASIAHTFKTNGNYSITHYVTSAAGCTDSLKKNTLISVDGATAAFTPSASKVKLPNATIKFYNRSNSYSNWTWNFGDSIYSTDKTPEHTYTEAGAYTVCLVGLNANGCGSTFCNTIVIENPNVLCVPEAFTPNGDNVNDVLRIRGLAVKEFEMRVYNEWGNLIFLTHSHDDGWDGTYHGAPQGTGVYEYSVKGKTMNNEKIDMHGVVNLIR